MRTSFVAAGRFRHQVQLLRRNEAQDTVGQATGYTPYGSARARIESPQASEVYRASTYTAEVSHVITLRWTSAFTVKSKDRVVYNGRTFDILAPLNPEERNRYLVLLCVELSDGAPAGA